MSNRIEGSTAKRKKKARTFQHLVQSSKLEKDRPIKILRTCGRMYI